MTMQADSRATDLLHSSPEASQLRRRKPFVNDSQKAASEDASLLTPPPTPPVYAAPTSVSQSDKDTREDPVPQSEIAKLWIRSKCLCGPTRSHPCTVFCPKLNEDPEKDNEHLNRKLSFANVRIAVRLWILLLPRLCKLFWTRHPYLSTLWVLRYLLQGILPTYRLWASSQMLDLVQEAITHGPLDVKRVLQVAAIAWTFESLNDVYVILSRRNTERLRESMDDLFETEYLTTNLSLPIQRQYDPYLRPLMYEAGVFSAANFRPNLRYPRLKSTYYPWNTFDSVVEIFSRLISIIMQISLLVRTTVAAGNNFFSYQALIPIFLAIAPLVCDWARKWIKAPSEFTRSTPIFESDFLDNSVIRRLARSDDAKQDIAIFGLKSWLLEQYAKTKEGFRLAREEERTMNSAVGLMTVELAGNGFRDLWNILLATGTMSTRLSLGSIRLYQMTTGNLSRSIDPLLRHLNVTFQMVFHLAAYVEATTIMREFASQPDDKAISHPLVDYEDERVGSGMKIEARGLGFAYQGKEPVLRDVNLAIEAGQTIAILGLNGAGKTTLTKVLMGLYGHTGSICINGRPIEQYDIPSIHKRTSCIFQDFHMFPMSISDNIGIGQVEHIRDEQMVVEARVRGGVKDDEKRDSTDAPATGQESKEAEEGDEFNKASRRLIAGRPILYSLLMMIWAMLLRVKTYIKPEESKPAETKKKRETEVPKMSGGEKQRVALARAFMRVDQADLLVFDEPSANLDPEAEEALFDQIHSLSETQNRKITTIFISHRVWTVHKADKIVVLGDSTIKEIGTHDELMELGGTYHDLYTRSRERFDHSTPASPTSPIMAEASPKEE